MYAYHIDPIDFGWEMLPRMETFIATLGNLPKDFGGSSASDTRRFIEFVSKAFRLAEEVGWEGDFRSGNEPRVFLIPVEDDVAYGLMWKQDNNGSTFVISPVEMPHLKKLALVGEYFK